MSRNNVLEKYIIDLCSPTLASLKTASLINCYFINEKQLEKDMAELNLLLNGKGIKIQTLRKSKKSVLIYVYRIDMLAKDLMKPGVKEVLTYYGYDSTEPEKAIEKLKMRLSETEPMFMECEPKLKGKKIALFGSYGWGDGEWMRTWEETCIGDGAVMACDFVICQETPDEEAESECKNLGKALI